METSILEDLEFLKSKYKPERKPPLSAEGAKGLMLDYHSHREELLIPWLEGKVEESARKGYKSVDKPLKGYSEPTLDAVGLHFTALGYLCVFTPFKDTPELGCTVSISW